MFLVNLEKRFDKKAKFSFKIYDVINCEATNCNFHIAQDKSNQTMKFDQLTEFNNRNFFLENCTKKVVEKLVLNPFLRN